MRDGITKFINDAPWLVHRALGKSPLRWGISIVCIILLSLFLGSKVVGFLASYFDQPVLTNTNQQIAIQKECDSFKYEILDGYVAGSNLLVDISNLSNFELSYSERFSSGRYQCSARLQINGSLVQEFPLGAIKILPNQRGVISIPIIQIQGFVVNTEYHAKIGLRCRKYIESDTVMECSNSDFSNKDFNGPVIQFDSPLKDKNILINVSWSSQDISNLESKGYKIESLRGLGGDLIAGSNVKITYTKEAWCDTAKCFKGYIWYNVNTVDYLFIEQLVSYYYNLGYVGGMDIFTDKSLKGGLSSKINSLPSELNEYAKYSTIVDVGFPKNNLWNNKYLDDDSIDIIIILPKMN